MHSTRLHTTTKKKNCECQNENEVQKKRRKDNDNNNKEQAKGHNKKNGRKKGRVEMSQADSIAYRKHERMRKRKGGSEGRVEVDGGSERHNIPGPYWTLLLGFLFILSTVRLIGPRHEAAGHTWITDKKRMQSRTISTTIIHASWTTTKKKNGRKV